MNESPDQKSNKTCSKQSGILLVDKASGYSSFYLVSLLRRLTKIEKIGHAGTLDPFATGVMVMLVGKEYTKRSNEFLTADKEYEATLHLGSTTDSYDIDGAILSSSDLIPSIQEVEKAIESFQGETQQIPPMYSAKKQNGKKLCDLARKGISVERAPVNVQIDIQLIHYDYPTLQINVSCSKGTYIRSLAHDIGQVLGCGAHLKELKRTRSGSFRLQDCTPQNALTKELELFSRLREIDS